MNIKKIISLVLACLTLAVTLTSCKKENVEEVTEVFIGADAIAEYAIIRADSADEETTAAASKLYLELKKKFGDKMTFTTDSD